MKITIPLLAATVSAQNARIGFPVQDQELTRGENITVMVQKPNSLTGSIEMGIAIGLASCDARPCLPANETLGRLLYHGPFKPEFHEPRFGPYENFTVTVPRELMKGKGQLNLAHMVIVGASAWPWLDTMQVPVVIT
ncbi:hypothetical protein BDV25DRAFT_39003 [Aspergillus avenaceus]|uniref:Uncharacterized protein n=1 Tax=Aspergillus avenaceus TaxID=36643 RepID=A0A5N6U3P7_ASPAV|nr:hypothetical protein BDV25DRAFT_39003 [Aspergillus avenaceus]